MALLVTSCTMGKEPSRLLDKGPSYLRTRTNTKLFDGRRRSAVELLEATRPQYVRRSYSAAADGGRPISVHFANAFNLSDAASPSSASTSKQSRSKSEHNLSQPYSNCLDCEITADTSRNQTIPEVRKTTSEFRKNGQIRKPPETRKPPEVRKTYPTKCSLHGNALISCRRFPHKVSEASLRKINMADVNTATASPSIRQKTAGANTSSNSPELRNIVQSRTSTSGMATDALKEVVAVGKDDDDDIERVESPCIPVHRSHSAINCRHHIRDSSVTSDRSGRYSRASTDLENFFNQMGLERNILDPMLRVQDVQVKRDFNMFESVSSLESPDTRSMCSGISKNEKALAEIDGEKPHSNVVERNARIIKWLCSVKKAKTVPP